MGAGKEEVGKLLNVIFILFLAGCDVKKDVQPAFYYWRTGVSLSNIEKHYIDSLQVEKLYIKFFDVAWDASRATAVPHAEVVFQSSDLQSYQIIPCIFITNQTFQHLPNDKIEWLAGQVYEKLFTLKQENIHFREIQFDCDWTAATRASFFTFLEKFKQKIQNQDITLSATIRLHQFRDHKSTGVPPVDRGILMFYNTGDVESWEEENSILNLENARYYLPTSDFLLPTSHFPLPLDLALPIFRWGVLFRDGRMIRLMNNLSATDLNDEARFIKIAYNRYTVLKSTYLDGYYLYQGDQIRLEAIDPEQLTQATDLLRNKLKNSDLTLAFYHLDTATIKYFPHEFLEKIIHQFQ